MKRNKKHSPRQPGRTKSKGKETREPAWSAPIPESQWTTIKFAADTLQAAGIPFLLGGALAIACYTGGLRNTHDGDFFIEPDSADAAIRALKQAGFKDYFDQCAYDRSWIFRGFKSGTIADLIWTTPNRLATVQRSWFTAATRTVLHGMEFKVVPVEELIWIKLFVLQRPRCDWPDLLNVVRICGGTVDWDRLIALTGAHVDLLRAMLTLFSWLSPTGLEQLPARIRKRFHLRSYEDGDPVLAERERVALLDSRAWYVAFQRKTELLQV